MKIEFINKEKTKSFSHAEDPKIQYKFTAFVYAFVETLKRMFQMFKKCERETENQESVIKVYALHLRLKN